ncbi:hypothetical protein HanRHA438_Chr02g0084821 [Helianthus annuus]|nr:hypothetical protein HanRHA438_Chr02g0084821 [Helianthus annuus]
MPSFRFVYYPYQSILLFACRHYFTLDFSVTGQLFGSAVVSFLCCLMCLQVIRGNRDE